MLITKKHFSIAMLSIKIQCNKGESKLVISKENQTDLKGSRGAGEMAQ